MKNPYKKIVFFYLITFIPVTYSLAQSPGSEKESKDDKLTAREILSWQNPQKNLFAWRKFQFINRVVTILSASTTDTSLDFKIQSNPNLPLYLSREELQQITPLGPDPMGEQLRHRYIDTPLLASITPLISMGLDQFRKKAKKSKRALIPGPNFPIPLDIEIDILKIVWKENLPTESDIYEQLDPSVSITAEDLRRILDEMVERGFLARRRISPSQTFSVFGIFEIEEKSLNRKNRQYIYWPLVEKSALITYLEAKRFLASTLPEERGSNHSKSLVERTLEEKLIRLTK